MGDYIYQQYSGFPPQADQVSANVFDSYIGVACEMDLFSPELYFSWNQISVLVSGFDIY